MKPGWRRGVVVALWGTAVAAAGATGSLLAGRAKPATHTVTIDATSYKPARLTVHVGDTVWLARRYGDAARQVVAAVAPGSHLVLMSPDDFERVQQGDKASGAWGFHLRRNDGWTRLIARGSGGAVGHVSFDVAHFVMEQKMMRGIRDRAQQTRRDQVNAFVGKETLLPGVGLQLIQAAEAIRDALGC